MSRAVRTRGLAIRSCSVRGRRRRRGPLKTTDCSALALRLPLDALEESRRRLREPAPVERLVNARENLRPNELAIGQDVLRQILDDLERSALAVPNFPNV